MAKHDFGIIDRELITKANSQYKLQQLDLLIHKIQDAIKENKYLIHYGI